MDRLGGAFDSFDGHDHFDDFVDDSDSHSNPPPSPVGQDERRMQVRAYNHWTSLLGDNRLPLIEDLEPEFLGDFGPHSVLLDFSTGSSTPTIQFIGDKLSKECGLYEDIEELGEVPKDSLLSQIADNYLKILSEQAPTGFEAEFVNAKGATVLYRGILLPYSSDCETLDFVYAVINWKEVADAETADRLLEQIDAALESTDQVTPEEAGEAPEVSNPVPQRKRNPLQLSDPEHYAPEPVAEVEQPVEEAYELPAQDEVEAYDEAQAEIETPSLAPAKKGRAVDALGNPIGAALSDDNADEGEIESGPGAPLTAADFGLPDWDDEEYEEDDVDELVNPLANIDLNSPLLSLVNPQTRVKKSLNLHGDAEDSDAEQPEEAVEDVATDYLATEEVSDEADALPEETSFEEAAPAETGEAEEVDTFGSTEAEEFDPVVEEATQPTEEIEASEEAVADDGFETYDQVAEEPPVEEPLAAEYEAEPEPDVAEVGVEDFAEEPLELTEELIEHSEDEAWEPVAEGQPEPEIVLEAPEVLEEAEPEYSETEAEVEFEAVEAHSEFEAEFEPAPVEGAEVEEAVVEEVAIEEASIEETWVEEAWVEETAEPASQPITAEELEESLAVASELAQPGTASDADTRKALYEAVRLAYDLAAYLRDEGNEAVTPAASEGIDALAEQLRQMEARDLHDLSVRGPEFALVMVRRGENGELTVLGEVPQEEALVGNAARKLLGK